MAGIALLAEWDRKFHDRIKSRQPRPAGSDAGSLLHAIPERSEWEKFCEAVRAEWPKWRGTLYMAPACLIMLYCGQAFFEYEDGGFWPGFARTVGLERIPVNDQRNINDEFERLAAYLNIPLRHRANSKDCVGSAVNLVGVPVAVWDDFLSLCYWALWNQGWKDLSGGEWQTVARSRCGGRDRLRRFLLENRELAMAIMEKMICLRQRLAEDPEFAPELDGSSLIRREYIEEVPATAEFLSPQKPERLYQDRVSLAFDKLNGTIYLRVPASSEAKLPAEWEINGITKSASKYPDRIELNSRAFGRNLLVAYMPSAGEHSCRRLLGVAEWAIFDLDDDGTMVNPRRTDLPTRRYALLSREPLDPMERKGFSEENSPWNEKFVLSDRTGCFLTVLDPYEERASLKFRAANGEEASIQLRPPERIECQFLPSYGPKLACFRRTGDIYHTQSMPTLCISVPPNFFGAVETSKQRSEKFAVWVNERIAWGKWQPFSGGRSRFEYFRWEWVDPDRPVMDKIMSGTTTNPDYSRTCAGLRGWRS